MKKKVFIDYTKERVVLSDILPYETPLIFSNRYFYQYLKKKEKSEKNESYKERNNKAYREIESILFDTDLKNQPFRFNICHKENDYRELNIIHPHNQLEMVEFYEKYKSLILYYSAVSPFSIRKPTGIARFSFYNDTLHKKNANGDLSYSQIEQEDSEYENLKSFFVYQKYSNIYKFYESYQFHRCEKKFNYLLKIDITKCFDSIYSHAIAWSIFNKSIVKSDIKGSLSTFPGDFDTIMQNLNAGETNGIVIGPEFSRIFAELILQRIDKNVYERLLMYDEFGKRLVHKKDYEIFRYVDDYFIFYNLDNDEERILKEYKLALKEYKLFINDSKSAIYTKPVITEISLAKQKISDLFSQHLEIKEYISSEENDKSVNDLYFSSNNVITRFKIIIKETNVNYKDIMNYSLAILDNKTKKIIDKWKSIPDEEQSIKIEKQFEKGLYEILDVSFFLYSVSPRVNSTIKLCLILNKILSFLKKNKTNSYKEPFSRNGKHNIFKKISDEIFLILQKNKTKKETQIETLYLLIALMQLGREYRLNPKVLCSYFNIDYKENKAIIRFDLNYFSIVVLLFYIKDIKQYNGIKEELKRYILRKFDSLKKKEWKSNTELVLLLMDILSCPYLNVYDKHRKAKIIDAKTRKSKNLNKYINEEKNFRYKFKKEILSLLGIANNHINLIESQEYWFIKWHDFDFGMELQSKRSQEVY